jgi:hypothetical protein
MDLKQRSRVSGNILLILLWVGLVLSAISFVSMLHYVYFFDFYYQYLSSFDDFISSFNFILYYITIIVFLVWIINVHRDLKAYDSTYPISSAGALLRILVPVVNIWGLWNTFSTLSRFIKKRLLGEIEEGRKLFILIPFLYMTLFSNYILTRLILREPENTSDALLFVAFGVELAMSIVFIMMTNTIVNSLRSASSSLTSNEEEMIPQDVSFTQRVYDTENK